MDDVYTPASHECTKESLMAEKWITPEANHKQLSNCHIVGNKFYSLINEESQHTKWEEFRRLAKMDGNEECSMLLQRMELEDSDEESDLLNDGEGISLVDAGVLPQIDESMAVEEAEEDDKINQKRKTAWGLWRGFLGQEDIRRMVNPLCKGRRS